jgi:hypothetical protein
LVTIKGPQIATKVPGVAFFARGTRKILHLEPGSQDRHRRESAVAGAGRLAYILPDRRRSVMCRNIRTLFNFEPPATEDEIRASALQFVRKLSGFSRPSQANAEAFDLAVEEVSAAARRLLKSLETTSPPRDRDVEAEKARARSRARFA